MGVTLPETAWERRARMIGPRQCSALRAAFDLTVTDLARLAGLPADMVRRVEWLGPGMMPDLEVTAARIAVSDAFAAIGGEWCAADPHDGAHAIHLVGRSIDDRRAIRAALALLPASIERLARRVRRRSGICEAELRRALRNDRWPFTALMAAECRVQMERASCYFTPASNGGWQSIGCDPEGWRQ